MKNRKFQISKFLRFQNFRIFIDFSEDFFSKSFGRKKFENFSNPNFQNQISPRKNINFLPDFFSSKDFVMYYAKMASTTLRTNARQFWQRSREKIHGFWRISELAWFYRARLHIQLLVCYLSRPALSVCDKRVINNWFIKTFDLFQM